MADCTVNIMMFGGRRCGKTSVITAMRQNFEEVSGVTGDLEIKVGDSATAVALEEKAQDIDTLFNERPYGEFNTDGRPTADGTEYLFSIERGGWNQDHIALNLYDFPGEWLTSKDKDKHKILEDRMKECGIIIIAIDTPYLMEPLSDVEKKPDRVGNWNDQRNYCRRITEMVKKNFTPDPNGALDPKMILFVPLKCEKYYAKDKMELVSDKIQKAYKNLLDYTNKGDNQGKYELVIAPILTFGKKTVEFSRFKDDEEGDIIMDERGRYPIMPLFLFVNRDNGYSPQFCEQPLLYALSYLFYQVRKIKEDERKYSGWLKIFSPLRKLGETFRIWGSLEDFEGQSEKIKRRLKRSGDGYHILSDPLELNKET